METAENERHPRLPIEVGVAGEVGKSNEIGGSEVLVPYTDRVVWGVVGVHP